MTTISKRICTSCGVAAVLVAGAFMLLPKGAHNGDAHAGPVKPAQHAQVTPETDLWKIVPADPLSPDGVSWTPLTGDGSN